MMSAKASDFVVRKPFERVECKKVENIEADVIEKEFRLIRDSKGNCSYIEVGERNVRDYIASFANGCSLKSILDRCALMPTHEKISYMNQRADGLGADLSNMPKDGTEAQIMICKVKQFIPDYAQCLRNGESFESLIAELLPKSASENVENTEVENNG